MLLLSKSDSSSCTYVGNGPQAYSWGHLQSQFCVESVERRTRLEQRVMATLAVQEELTMYGDVLERVDAFKYLGHKMSMTADDAHVVRAQLVKAC